MKIDELISELEDVKVEHGNLEVESTNYASTKIFGLRIYNEKGIVHRF